MSNEIAAALIGVGGAVIGAAITYAATMRSARKGKLIRRNSDRNEQIINVMADFLTEYTAQIMLQYPGEIAELERQLERLFKNLDMHGQHDIARRVQREGGIYLDALRLYTRGGLSLEQLNDRRVRARKAIEKVVARAA